MESDAEENIGRAAGILAALQRGDPLAAPETLTWFMRRLRVRFADLGMSPAGVALVFRLWRSAQGRKILECLRAGSPSWSPQTLGAWMAKHRLTPADLQTTPLAIDAAVRSWYIVQMDRFVQALAQRRPPGFPSGSDAADLEAAVRLWNTAQVGRMLEAVRCGDSSCSPDFLAACTQACGLTAADLETNEEELELLTGAGALHA